MTARKRIWVIHNSSCNDVAEAVCLIGMFPASSDCRHGILLFDPRREHSSAPISTYAAPLSAAAIKDGRFLGGRPKGLSFTAAESELPERNPKTRLSPFGPAKSSNGAGAFAKGGRRKRRDILSGSAAESRVPFTRVQTRTKT